MSLLQKSPLVLLSFNFMLMVWAANHDQFNASRTTMASELSTSTFHPRNTASISQGDMVETSTLNSSYSSSSNAHGLSSTFKLSNTSSLTSKAVMTGDNGLNKAEAREEGGNVTVIGNGYVEVKITQLSIGVCLGGCYDDLQICYEAKNPSSDLPQTICGSPTQCGLRFGTLSTNKSRVWFMNEIVDAPRAAVAECKYANIRHGRIEYNYQHKYLGVTGAGCDPIIVSNDYTKIYVKGASMSCPVLIGNAQLKPEPTTVVPQSDGILVDATTPEASNFELYLGLGIGFGILFIITIGVIIGVLWWRRRQAKQQKSPPQPIKAVKGKTTKDMKTPEPVAVLPPLKEQPEDKKEKSLLYTCLDEDVEKAEPVKKETVAEARKDDAKTVEAKTAEEVQPAKKPVKEKEQMLVVDETQEDSQQKTAPPPPAPVAKKVVKKAATHPPKLCRPLGNEVSRHNVVYGACAPAIDDPRRRSFGGPRSGCKSSGSRKNYDSLREGRKPIDARFLESANQCLRNGGAFADKGEEIYRKIQIDYPHVEGRQMVAIEEELFLGSVDEMAQKAEHLSGKAEEKLLDKGFGFDDASKLKTLPPGGRRYLQARTTPHYVVAFAFGAEYDYHLKFADTSWRTVSIPLLFVIILTPRIPREARVKAAYQLRKLVMGKNWQDQSLDDKWFPVYAIGAIRKAVIEKEAELKKAKKVSESKETKETTTGGE